MDGLEALIGVLVTLGIKGDLWVDGSFATQKIDPEDVDVVLCLDEHAYNSLSVAQDWFLSWWVDNNLRPGYGCDTYVSAIMPTGHPVRAESEKERRYWRDWFGKTRTGIPKGIISIGLPEGSIMARTAKGR